jgi:pimeloyl-ACP methyl ester carboxylesterase
MKDELRSTVGAVWLNHVRHGHGDPLILLHSLGGSLIQWSPVMDRLAAEREVIALDMPGFGESAELPEGVSPRAANLATAVLDFYDALGIEGTPAVAGISLGGWVAVECARQGGASAVVALCPAGFWKRSPEESNRALARRRRRDWLDRCSGRSWRRREAGDRRSAESSDIRNGSAPARPRRSPGRTSRRRPMRRRAP